MTPPDGFPTLKRPRGVRAALLRRLPPVWHTTPQTSSVAIPALQTPAVSEVACALRSDVVPNAFARLTGPRVLERMVRFDPVMVSLFSLPFDVYVLGIRYGSPAQSNAPQEAEMVLPGFVPDAGEEGDMVDPRYASLYHLLFAPAEEMALGQMPGFEE